MLFVPPVGGGSRIPPALRLAFSCLSLDGPLNRLQAGSWLGVQGVGEYFLPAHRRPDPLAPGVEVGAGVPGSRVLNADTQNFEC